MEQVTEQDLNFLRQAIDLARQARNDGRHPFGALIVNEQGETVVAARNNAVRPLAIPHSTQKWWPAPRLPSC